MCGILFYLKQKQQNGTNNNQLNFETSRGIRTLKRRGLDGTNILEFDNATLFFSRLAIIGSSHFNQQWLSIVDSSGMQPLTNPEYPHWHVLCNGEIYNYKQLAFDHNIDITKLRSDVEILLYLNPKKITEWASKISGDFSAIFYNDKTGEFVLIRDQIGVRPLYVAYDSNNEIFASASIQDPLLELQGTVRVKQFPPGHLYLSSTGRTVRYSNLFSTPTSSQSPSPCITNEITAMNGVSTILLESVRKRLLHSHVPVAVLCSGGSRIFV
jgi:asparagine synthase (glutamine-hydrolysing)